MPSPARAAFLPKAKITDEVARIRLISKEVDAISPNRHREISNVDDLLDMIERIRSVTGKPCGFKMVLGQAGFLDDLCQAIHRRGVKSAPGFHQRRFRRWRHRGGTDDLDGRCRDAAERSVADDRRQAQ